MMTTERVSFEYIESALIFGLDNKINLRAFKHGEKDFVKHGEAYRFILKHFDDYGEFPSSDVLCNNFPTLDVTSQSVNFEYAMEVFKDHVMQRQIVRNVQSVRDLVKDNPKKALSTLMVSLTDIEVVFDEDVTTYDTGGLERLSEFKERTKKRKLGDGLIGVPTSFKTLNEMGIGWEGGDLIAMFARPTIGKTWMCVHAAATAVQKGFRTLLVSTEMPVQSINLRLDVVLANLMGYKLSHADLRHGNPIDEEMYTNFLSESNASSLLVCDHISGQNGISLESISALVRKHAPEFVVIDGVYLISNNDSRKAAWEQSHALFYGLKNLATSTNTPIMVSTQATRDAANMFSPPRAAQVAFGDALIRAADVAMAMCALEEVDDKRLVQFQKYRNGELTHDTTIMQWQVNSGNIYEMPDYEWQEF